jgi:hypothetical protein
MFRKFICLIPIALGCGVTACSSAPTDSDVSVSTDEAAVYAGSYNVVGRWKGPNCAGSGAWYNLVYLNMTSNASGSVRYYYPRFAATCTADLTRTTATNPSTYDESNVSAGCTAGEVTIRQLAADRIFYTWSDPTGTTPTCDGELTKTL